MLHRWRKGGRPSIRAEISDHLDRVSLLRADAKHPMQIFEVATDVAKVGTELKDQQTDAEAGDEPFVAANGFR